MYKIILAIILTITIYANEIILNKQADSNNTIVTWYLKEPSKVSSVEVLDDNKTITLSKNIIAPNEEFTTSIIFLIDTSKSMKRAFRGVKSTLKEIISSLDKNRHNFAIASFDKELTVLKDFNDSFDSYEKALNNIKVKGSRTELYRLSIEAIKMYDKVKSNRKILVLLSDGDFEDTTYNAKDLVQKANENSVQILALGYKDSVKLQGILRPAVETNGKLWIANKKSYLMSQDFLIEFMPYLDNGGELAFKNDFSSSDGKKLLNLVVNTYYGTIKKDFETEAKVPIKVEPVKAVKSVEKKEEKSFIKNYLIIIIILTMLTTLLLLYLLLKRNKKREEENQEETQEENLTPIATIEDDSGKVYNIYKNKSSIGRENDNDIVIDGAYISNYHADIIYKNGKFYIIDNNSLNGVGINNLPIKSSKVMQSEIKDGDIIYFGPMKLKFKIL